VEDGRTLVLASGDGGFLMGLSDLESLIGAASSAVVVIYNDAAYGAEIHQYGSQGLTEKPMLIPEVDFSGIARAWGLIRQLSGLCRIFPRSPTGSTPGPGEPSWPTAVSRRASAPRG
jgi:hypothetical protein